jgi:hypothetical protein
MRTIATMIQTLSGRSDPALMFNDEITADLSAASD